MHMPDKSSKGLTNVVSTGKRTLKPARDAGTHPQQTRKIYPGRGDPIRIVPLDDAGWGQPTVHAAAAARAAPPQLTYRDGPLLTAVEVFTMFWGTARR